MARTDKPNRMDCIMDDSTKQHLRTLFYEKILRYSDLQRCFQEEKASLIGIDVSRLWELSRQKEEICGQIEVIRRKMLAVIPDTQDQNGSVLRQVYYAIPPESRSEFEELHHTIVRLKGEIDAMRKENMAHIDQSLQFLDEIISVMAGAGQTKATYDNKRRLRKSTNMVFLSKEA